MIPLYVKELEKLRVKFEEQRSSNENLKRIKDLQVDELNLAEIGPKFEHHNVFPARTNTGSKYVCCWQKRYTQKPCRGERLYNCFPWIKADGDHIDRILACLHLAIPFFMRGASTSKFLSPRLKLLQQCMKYLGPIEKLAFEVGVENVKLFYTQICEPLDTTTKPHAKLIFVLSTSEYCC